MTVRPATVADLDAIAVLAAQLVRQHHAIDPRRFLLMEPAEKGYRWWFGREVENPNAVILAAERHGEIVGYAYGRLEERDWNQLLDAHGALHDILVRDDERRGGVATQLLESMIDTLVSRGAPRVVLYTAWQNHAAQALFKRAGFRPTMIEMTREAQH